MKNKVYNLESARGSLVWQYNSLPMALMGLTNHTMLGARGLKITCEGKDLYRINEEGRIVGA